MKFPKVSELDEDQLRLYEGSPATGSILIEGPPGTGKTVIAFHRAAYLARLGQSPHVSMYNKVLAQFTSTGRKVASKVDVTTQHSWTGSYWYRNMGNRHCPIVNGERWLYDWDEIRKQIGGKVRSGSNAANANWGHLIIDEGQDFPESMYVTLKSLMLVVNAMGANPPCALTVLADDNQRLNPNNNSRVEQIRAALGLHKSDKNVFRLKRNYRNTFEIASFARNFFVGLPSGCPDLPVDRHGDDLPVVSISSKGNQGKDLNAFVEKIARFAKNNPCEIGVLVHRNEVRKSMVNRLKPRLEPAGIKLQTYASDEPAELVFDKEGYVTVLNFASAKGLEFDAVFVIDPGRVMANSGASELAAKMSLYVMCSRARTFLNLMLIEDQGSRKILEWVGDPKGYEREDL